MRRRELSASELASLRPGVDRDALEELLGALPDEVHAEILAYVSHPGASDMMPPRPQSGATNASGRLTVVRARVMQLEFGDPDIQALLVRTVARMR